GDLETTGGPSVPVADYHPSHQLGEAAVDDPETINGTADADTIDAGGGDDTVDGGDGADNIKGGYGNDLIIGGKGNDVLEGGRGSDWLRGGDGDDLIVGRSDAGEQKIGQIVVGNVTRPDNGEVNYDRQKLIGWEDQALVADDIYEGGAGRDTFLITAQINAKLEIIEKHVRSDGSINWAGVAGENTYVRDHWTDSFGIDTILDYNAEEDTIAIIGHTAEICDVSYRDVDGDGDIETIITVWSNQSGPCVATGDATCHCAGNAARAGGAHDQDLIGQLIVHGDRVEEDDIITDAGVTFGIVDNISEVAEAIFPAGETKQTVINGDVVYGYDTRGTDGSWGAVTGSPEDHIDNPFLAAALANTAPPTPAEDIELTREPFGQIAELEVAGVTRNGTAGDDLLRPDMRPSELKPGDLPGALGFWSMANGDEGAYGDLRGELGAITAYELDENQAILRQDGAVRGPDGRPGTALSFNGKTDFAYLDHDPAFQVTMGTMAVWVRADDLSNAGAIVTKDQSGSGEGGHFRLIHLEDGNLLLRMAPGNGEGNKAWKTKAPVLEEGVWSHLAVSFNDKGVTIYENGRAIANNQWEPVEGNVPSPGVYGEAYMVQNTEPFVFGADQVRTKVNDTAQAFAADDDKLVSPFEGAMAGFGFWGGFKRGDVLTPTEVRELYNDGPGTALTAPSGTLPRLAGDDVMYGRDGNDEVKGWAGDDKLHGNDGNDTVEGHYGDDILFGGNGHDVLNGGRGSDLVIGGKGNDILIGGGDAGEDRLGQIVLDQN
ncbi:MAG: LamG-like jellyroll fold domain-containing protein, partial [Pseudomonadota bacterium]